MRCTVNADLNSRLVLRIYLSHIHERAYLEIISSIEKVDLLTRTAREKIVTRIIIIEDVERDATATRRRFADGKIR